MNTEDLKLLCPRSSTLRLALSFVEKLRQIQVSAASVA